MPGLQIPSALCPQWQLHAQELLDVVRQLNQGEDRLEQPFEGK
jgi:exonuclease VII small subunit